MDRRTLLTSAGAALATLAAAPAALGARARPAATPESERGWGASGPHGDYFPNVVLTTHEGKQVRFYDDLIQGKTFLLNFFYIGCLDGLCPRATANLVRVQELLGDEVGRDVFMYSITLNAAHDRPKKLKEYMTALGVKAGWTFLTGKPADIEMLRRRLGFAEPDQKSDRDKANHTGMVRYGNEARSLWAACPALSTPQEIVKYVGWVKA